MKRDPLLESLNRTFPRRQPEPPYNPHRHSYFADVIVLLVLGLICVQISRCQTISPVISEAKGPLSLIHI